MLLVADVNTLWRSRPFEALAEHREVLGLCPQDWLLALRAKRWPWRTCSGQRGVMLTLGVTMPLRWARPAGTVAQRRLWRAASDYADSLGEKIEGLVVTSPHYLPLCREVQPWPVFYYCSDDYRNYAGWDAGLMAAGEKELTRLSQHSFFVSEELRQRAIREYGLAEDSTSVSMNATDESFLVPVPESVLSALREKHALTRPVVGVIGGINRRLSFELLRTVSQMPEMGTLLLVGPADEETTATLQDLLKQSTKVKWVGPQPHEELPVWHRLLDVALIPYEPTEFNRHCSPMRLFDHLAAGCPTVSTTACPQVRDFPQAVQVGDGPEFISRLRETLARRPHVPPAQGITWSQRGQTLHQQFVNLLP